MNAYKTCIRCARILSRDQFTKDSTRLDGKHPYCKNCVSLNWKRRYENNRKKYIDYQKQYRLSHPEKRHAYQERTRKHRQLYMKEWRRREKQHIKEYKKRYHETFEKHDIDYRILHNLRTRLILAIKDKLKSAHTKELVGCTIKELKIYLESKFRAGMSWDNYGRKGWHIDHIVPCSKFDLSHPEEQRKCFHYTNLQPLWAIDNCIKNKY